MRCRAIRFSGRVQSLGRLIPSRLLMFSTWSLAVTAGLFWLTFGGCGAACASLPVAWDLRMGPSLTGVSAELADSLDRARIGFDAGVGIRWPRSGGSLGIQGELLLVSRSRSFEDMVSSGFGAGVRFRRSLQVLYAQMPLLARASLSRKGKFRPYALAGPYIAWRLSSRFNQGRYVGDEPVNPSDVRARDAGGIVGLGSDLVTAKARFAVEVRVGQGFVDVLEGRSSVKGDYRVLTLLFAVTPTR